MRRLIRLLSALLVAAVAAGCSTSSETTVKNGTLAPPAREKFYVAAMGDSFGSGEGNPKYGNGRWSETQWYSAEKPEMAEICHRSSKSGFYKAVRRLEVKYPNIEFVRKNFACSGAIVEDLISDRQVPSNKQFEASGRANVGATQLEMLRDWMRAEMPTGRALDALYLSIGGNNAKFAAALETCFALPQDYLPGCVDVIGVRVDPVLNGEGRGTLYALYNELNEQIEGLGPRQVVISTYPNFAKKRDGSWCDMNLISPSEFEGLWGRIGVPLNDRINERADAFGWSVATMENRMIGHGICEERGRWINTAGDAKARQGEDMGKAGLSTGMYHPNDAGYEAYADAIVEKVEARLVKRLTPTVVPAVRVTQTSITPTANTVVTRNTNGQPWWMVQTTTPAGGAGLDAVTALRVVVKRADGATIADTYVPATQATFFVRMPANASMSIAACGYKYGPRDTNRYCNADVATPTWLTGSTSTIPVGSQAGRRTP